MSNFSPLFCSVLALLEAFVRWIVERRTLSSSSLAHSIMLYAHHIIPCVFCIIFFPSTFSVVPHSCECVVCLYLIERNNQKPLVGTFFPSFFYSFSLCFLMHNFSWGSMWDENMNMNFMLFLFPKISKFYTQKLRTFDTTSPRVSKRTLNLSNRFNSTTSRWSRELLLYNNFGFLVCGRELYHACNFWFYSFTHPSIVSRQRTKIIERIGITGRKKKLE